MRIVFMGSSSASAVCLKGLLRYPELQVVGLVTQPDRPAGRGRELTPCPCRKYAIERGIKECITPESVNTPESLAWIRAKKPDAIAVVAFGQFLKKEILELPPFGCINCHFSLLPKYRGAAPVTAAVLAGDELSGVSVIKMGLGMDDGPILMSKVEPVYPEDTAETLMEKLAICGGVTLAKTMRMLAAGTLPPPVPQEEARVTFAHKIKKTDGLIDWSRLRSYDIERMLRAYMPWPGCYTFLPMRLRRKGMTGRVAVMGVEFVPSEKIEPAWRGEMPGTVLATTKRGPIIRTLDGAVLLLSLKAEGARAMGGGQFLLGRPLTPLTDMLLNE